MQENHRIPLSGFAIRRLWGAICPDQSPVVTHNRDRKSKNGEDRQKSTIVSHDKREGALRLPISYSPDSGRQAASKIIDDENGDEEDAGAQSVTHNLSALLSESLVRFPL